jgi:hypothetical protein
MDIRDISVPTYRNLNVGVQPQIDSITCSISPAKSSHCSSSPPSRKGKTHPKRMSAIPNKKLASAGQITDGLSDIDHSIKTLRWKYIRSEFGNDDPSSGEIIRHKTEFGKYLSVQKATLRLAYYINFLYDRYLGKDLDLGSNSTTLLVDRHDRNKIYA